ncbi:hypothetical protein [Klebsiella pneumoniae]|uniref:hypothetical protein n=1 Tax=Klebsiella pneumoniae TaxID=573 RepID=UPI00388EF858
MLLLFRIFPEYKELMVKKSLRQFTLMATATVTLLLGSAAVMRKRRTYSKNLPN